MSIEKKYVIPIAIILLVAVAYYATGGRLLSAIQSGSILSLSQVSYTNNFNDPHGSNFAQGENVWLANIVMNGMGQSLQGYTTPDELQGGGQQSQDPVSLNVNLDEMACRFTASSIGNGQTFNRKQLVSAGTVTYSYVYEQVSRNGGTCSHMAWNEYDNYEDACINIGGTPINCDTSGTEPYDWRQCLKAENIGDTYRIIGLNTPAPEWTSRVSFYKGNNAPEVITLSSSQLGATSSQGHVRAWVAGILGSPQNPYCPGNQELFFNVGSHSTRRVLSPGSYNNIQTNPLVLGSALITPTVANERLAIWNNRITSYIDSPPPDNQFAQNSWSINSGGSGTDGIGSLRLDRMNQPFGFPSVELIIRATWLQIVNPLAQPGIVSVTPSSFNGRVGEATTETVRFANIGTSGTILTSMTCSPSASVLPTPPSESFWLNANAETTRTYQLYCQQSGSASCTIHATDSEGGHPAFLTFSGSCAVQCNTQCPYPSQIVDPATCNCVCPTPPPTCGNNQVYSPIDCTCHQIPGGVCGDGACNNGETHLTCLADCPAPQCTACTDSTPVGSCSTNNVGFRCIRPSDNVCSLQADANCGLAVCPPGYHMANGQCVPDANECTGPLCNLGDNVAYIAGGIVVLLLIVVYANDQGWFSGRRKRR